MPVRWVAILGVALLSGVFIRYVETPSDDSECLSYALGMDDWNRLQERQLEVDPKFYIMGFLDARSGSQVQLSENEVRAILDGHAAVPGAGRFALPGAESWQNGETGCHGVARR